MLPISADRIEKQIQLNAPRSRVWRALTDYREFSAWFEARMDSPFVAGQSSKGHVTYPGYEHLRFEIVVQKIEPETFFGYTWHPYPNNPQVDYSTETPTLVEFRLQDREGGTLLSITESGFSKLPEHRRDEAFRKNDAGWTEQMENLKQYVSKKN